METIEVNAVSQIYRDNNGNDFAALRNVSFQWKKGESIAVMGESGSGKSTLARIVAGLEKPSKGTLRIDGQDTVGWNQRKWREIRMQLQAVFQDATGTLSPSRSALQNAEEALYNLTSLNKRQRRERIYSLMEQMELKQEILETPVNRLSGGEQRRLGLLRSLAIEPRFLVLDEITAGLDLISAEAVLRVLREYQRTHECNYLLITHDESTAARLCSRLFEIDHGQIIHESVRYNENEGE